MSALIPSASQAAGTVGLVSWIAYVWYAAFESKALIAYRNGKSDF
jgi:hypothetical protein